MKSASSGVPVAVLCRMHGISAATFFRWKRRYRADAADAADRIAEADKENRRLRGALADLLVQLRAVHRAMLRMHLTADDRRALASALIAEGLSERRACWLAACNRSVFRYRSRRATPP